MEYSFGIICQMTRPPFRRAPSLFLIARYKDNKVVDYLGNRNGCFCGNLLFIREVQNWELEYMVQLLDNVYTTKLHHREEDKLEWMPSKTQSFQVKSYYKELRGGRILFP